MGKIKKLNFLEWASIILAGALFLCLANMPYGFYILIRYTVMIVGGVWAYQFFKMGKMSLALTSAAIAVLFQPIIKITLDRSTWTALDILIAIALLLLVFAIGKEVTI